MNKLGTVGTTELWGDGTTNELRTNVGDGKALVSLLTPPVVTPPPPPPPPPPVVTTGRVLRVATANEFRQAALNAVPGDTLLIVANTGPIEYQSQFGAKNGVPGKHIKIQCNTGIVIDGNGANDASLDVVGVSHIDVDVASTRTLFGPRAMGVRGTAASPCRWKVNVRNTRGHGLKISASYFQTGIPADPSSHIIVEDSLIADQAGGEGIYIGTGDPDWWDQTSNITLRRVEVARVAGVEGMDIKPYTRNILVEDCLIHDIGGVTPSDNTLGMSVNVSWVTPSKYPLVDPNIVIRNNRIWNINATRVATKNDCGIWSGGGGVDIVGNKIWNVPSANSTGILVWAPHQMGATLVNDIRDNVVLANGIRVLGLPGVVNRVNNYGPAGVEGIQNVRSEAELRALIG